MGEETAKLIASNVSIVSSRKNDNNTPSKRFPNAVWTPLREITRPSPNEKWQVDGLIKAGNLVILSARPKTAKSIVGLNLAACIAMDKPFLNRSTTQGRTLFVAWERHDLTVQRAFAMGVDACEDFMVWDKRRFGVAPRVDALDWWKEFIVANNIRLVVFDTLAHFLRPELDKVRSALNAYDYIGSVLERVAQVANETGCTFLLIHHDRKGEGDTDEQRVLGTTAITAAADVVLQLQPRSDDAGVMVLKAMGNAIDDQVLHFIVQPNFWLEPTERSAVTKEEKAANAIVEFLRQHGEAKRKELEGHLQEIGLAESRSAAEKLATRALSLLQGKIIRTQRGAYRLVSDFGHSDTPISDVHVVRNHKTLSDNSDNLDKSDMSEMSEMSEVSELTHHFRTTRTTYIMSSESQNDASERQERFPSSFTDIEFDGNDGSHAMNDTDVRHFRHSSFTNDDGYDGHDGSRVTNITQCPSLPSNTIEMTDDGGRVTDVTSDWQWDYIASDIPTLPELVSFGNLPEQVSFENPIISCQYTEIDVSCPQSPEIPEPAYSTLRNEELIDTELLISELDELCAELSAQQKRPALPEQPEQSTLPAQSKQTEISEQPAPSEQAAQPPQTLNKPTHTGNIPSLLEQAALSAQSAQLTQPKPSLPDHPLPDHLACLCGSELRLFGKTFRCLRCDSPRPAVCRRCGKALKFIAENRAECIGCGAPYVFDRNRRLWLCDEDIF
jgi:hypothetical protein